MSPGTRIFRRSGPDLLQVGLEMDLLVAELADLFVKGLPGDAGDGILAGRIDLGQDAGRRPG